MPQGGARGQNLGHLRMCFFVVVFLMESLVFEQQILFKVDSVCDLRPQGLVPLGGARGQNLEHLRFFFILCF